MKTVFALLLFAAAARPDPNCEQELVMRENIFAKHFNRRLQTSEADPQKRAKDKEKLAHEWEALERCECF